MLTAFMATSVIARAIGAETRFSDYCEARMQEFDEKLDDPNFIDQLYNGQPVERDGQGRECFLSSPRLIAEPFPILSR